MADNIYTRLLKQRRADATDAEKLSEYISANVDKLNRYKYALDMSYEDFARLVTQDAKEQQIISSDMPLSVYKITRLLKQ